RETLARHGVRAGDRVGICAPKSIGTVIGVFGALKAGAAYVPVDASAPAQRNALILGDCSVRVVITTEDRVEGLRAANNAGPLPRLEALGFLDHLGVGLVLLGGPEPPGPAAEPAPRPTDPLAYILYTSGSTGRPKGVVH